VSKPLTTCRNPKAMSKPRGYSTSGLTWEVPAYCPSGIRHTSGVISVQAPVRNVGTCRPDIGVSRGYPGLVPGGRTLKAGKLEGESTDAGHGGRPAW